MGEITSILGNSGISIEAVIQKDPRDEKQADIILLTHKVREKQMNAAIEKIKAMDATFGNITRIRMESLGR